MNTQGDNFIAKITRTNDQDQEQNREKGKCESVEAEPISRRTDFSGGKVLVVTDVFDGGEGEGEALGERDMRLVVPKMKRVVAVERPATVIWGKERRGSEMATAAMDFMGWTSIGMPKRKLVEML
ncbi:hypothetical protein PVL29_003141 [Vitis rotundifolia]|uniref:Uncharacterized protein n=1 Tax=Vitis rotundifolia TaxID=103349 RepID=A0AA39AC97_VITRO|nr:hypothetical protein PVL29_003141 [Vitis rotundifolia]